VSTQKREREKCADTENIEKKREKEEKTSKTSVLTQKIEIDKGRSSRALCRQHRSEADKKNNKNKNNSKT
jgi:hypothetical protein